ncbi:MAG: outer membrane beta-barrel protein [Ferruginibacter sp.]
MKTLFFLAATILSLSLLGQEKLSDRQTPKFKRLQIGIIFSPDYNFRKLNNNDGSPSSDLLIKNRNDKEIGKFGYTTGIDICVKLTEKVGFETGIQYSNKGYQTKKQNLVFSQPDPSLPTTTKIVYVYHYIDIPLKVNLMLGQGRIRLISSVGVTTNILMKENYKKVNFSPMAGIGIDYKINNQINLRVEPTFRYGILYTTDTPVTENLWNTGLNIGLYFKLNNE